MRTWIGLSLKRHGPVGCDLEMGVEGGARRMRQLQRALSLVDHGFDLAAVTHDPLIGQQAVHFAPAKARDMRDINPDSG